jgi:hypothetical protein
MAETTVYRWERGRKEAVPTYRPGQFGPELRSLPAGPFRMPDGSVVEVVPAVGATPACVVADIEVGREEYVDREDGGKLKVRPTTLRLPHYYITRDEEIAHLEAWWAGLKVLGIDTETSGISVYDNKTATLQWGHPKCADPRCYVIDVRGLSDVGRTRVLAPVGDGRVVKLGMNIKFECLYLQHEFGVRARNVACVQAAELLLRAGLFPQGKGGAGGDGQDKKAYQFTSMKSLTQYYQGIDIDKDHDLRVSFYVTPVGRHSIRQVLYAGGDTIHPFYIAEGQKPELRARDLKRVLDLEFAFIPVLVDTELAGVGIDERQWMRLWQQAVAAQDLAERALDQEFLRLEGDLFGGLDANVRPIYPGGVGKAKKPEPLNWRSPVQLKWAIRQYCLAQDWPIQVITTRAQLRAAKLADQECRAWLAKKGLTPADIAKTDKEEDEGGRTIPDWLLDERKYCLLLETDADTLTLRMLRDQLPAKFIAMILAYAEQKSLMSTFGVDYLQKNRKADGRIHVEFHQLIAATGRMSTTPNLQNIPRITAYRKAFVPRKGWRFVICDMSQIEPRISAQMSRDEVYVTNYKDRKNDLYVSVGQAMLGRPIDKKTDQGKADRQAAKATVLGMAYRMGARKLRDKLTLDLNRSISFEQAAELHARFLESCSGIVAFQDAMAAKASPETGDKIWDARFGCEVTYVTSLCGRHRFFLPDAKNTMTESANHPIQALSASIIKLAGVLIHEYIREHDIPAHAVNFVHDEIVYEVREDYAEAFAPVVKAKMEEAGRFYVPDVDIVAEYPEGSNGVVPYWAKEIHADEEPVLQEAA